MRISGIASGFDTEEMVRQLMKVERMKVDRFEQNRQTILWRQESYNNINKSFANFILNTQKDMGLKKANSTGSLFSNSYKNLDYVRKATSSNEATATVTSTGKTANGSFDIRVREVPQNASFTSAEITDEKLVDANGERLKSSVLKIGDHEITVGDGEKDITINDVVKAINNAKDEKGKSLGISAFYDSGTGRMFLESSEGGAKMDITGEIGNIMVGTGIQITPDEGEIAEPDENQSISQAGTKGKVTINGLEVGVKNGKVEFNGLIIDIKAEGTTRINVSTNTEGIMEKIEKLIDDYNNLVDLASGLVNEKVYSSYKPLSQEERKALSESDVKLWDEKAKSGLLNRDETLQRILQNIRTDLYRDVEGASFKNITQIGITTEKYARGSAGGKLQIDTDKLRKAIEEDPEGVMELLFKEPDAIKYEGEPKPVKPVQGKGEGIDEDESDEAFKVRMENYDAKLKLYEEDTRIHNRAERNNRRDSGGIFTRVYDNLIDGMKNIIEKSGPGEDADLYRGVRSNMLIDFVTKKSSISDLDKSISEMDRQIDNLNILLAKREEMHYAKFTAMEKAMYQMNNQSGWLAQQFA